MLQKITDSTLFLFFERLSRIIGVCFFLVGLPVLLVRVVPVIEQIREELKSRIETPESQAFIDRAKKGMQNIGETFKERLVEIPADKQE